MKRLCDARAPENRELDETANKTVVELLNHSELQGTSEPVMEPRISTSPLLIWRLSVN